VRICEGIDTESNSNLSATHRCSIASLLNDA
jgi:hypothetical protein